MAGFFYLSISVSAPSNFIKMKEDFLHYVWKFQKFKVRNLETTNGDSIKVSVVGQHNKDSGPDFFNAKVSIADQLWAGNVEIHLKSSDWYAHNHEKDANYDNVILHVVWEYDTDVFRNNNTVIPTCELKHLIEPQTLSKYRTLFSKNHKWINCETDFGQVDEFLLKNWLERLYIERLEQKSKRILNELNDCNNHWEALLFRLLCKNFGMMVNREAFLSIARSLDFSIVQKCKQDQFDLESLLIGQAGLLSEEKEDGYYKSLQKNYEYQKHKFGLKRDGVISPKFFRLRPPNFPTIRLSQLASLYFSKKQLFSEVIFDISLDEPKKTMDALYSVFNVSAGQYWDSHFNFGVTSVKRKKVLTKKFVDVLLMNTIIPLQFCYAKQLGKDTTEALLGLAAFIPSEENTIVKKFNELRPMSSNSLDSQALLQLKNEYCTKMRCLECAIGNSILKG